MPSPVILTVSSAPLPFPFEGTPQQFATALTERLTVVPADPWTAFQVVGATPGTAPTANFGPIMLTQSAATSDDATNLRSGKTTWQYWDTSAAYYKHIDLDGRKLINATVPLASLADAGAKGSVLISNQATPARYAELTAASGTGGQVLTLVGGTTPTWVDTFVPTSGGNIFEVTLAPATPQVIPTTSTPTTVSFAAKRLDDTDSFNLTDHRWPVNEGEFWFFYAKVQFSDSGAGTTAWAITLNIRRNGAVNGNLSSYLADSAAIPTVHLSTMGVMKIGPGETYVDVGVTASGTGADIQAEANVSSTVFGGFRIL